MPDPALEVRGLTKSYGPLVALAPLDLRVAEGERVMLVGHNGSGKTTLLRLLAGLLDPTGGDALVSGEAAGSIDARAALSYVPDDPVLYDDLSLGEHLQYVAGLHGTEHWQDRAAWLVERFGLAARWDDLPSTFSRGLRQKTSLALGLVRPFDVLVVDEPFVGLDPRGREVLVELLAETSEEGATVVVATHQMDLVGWASRCVALRDGAKVHDGPADPETLRSLTEP